MNGSKKPARRSRTVADAAAVLLGFAGYVSLLGISADTTGLIVLLSPVILALVPVAVFLALRAPMIFPFGLWTALLPFDYILSYNNPMLMRVFAAFTAAVLLLHMIWTRKMVTAPKSWLPWLLVVLWMSLTSLWSIGPAESVFALSAMLPLFLIMTVVAIYPITVNEMRWVLISIVLGSLVATIWDISLYAHGQYFGDGRVTLMTESGAAIDPNVFATSFLLPMAICLGIVLLHRSVWMRLFAGGAMAAMIVAIFLSGSRGASISLCILFAYIVWKTRNRWIPLIMVVASGFAFTLFPSVLRRFGDDNTVANGSGRTFIWDVGAKALSDHNHWLFGVGVGAFPVAYNIALRSVYQPFFQGWSRPAHNVLLGTSVELGIFGAVLLVYAWWRTFRQAAVVDKASPNYVLRLIAEASIIGLFVNALFIDPLMIKYYWFSFMLPMMISNLEHPVGVRRARGISPQFAAIRMRRALMSANRR